MAPHRTARGLLPLAVLGAVGAAASDGGAELPSSSFPGQSAEESHAAWPSGRQPQSLQRWPRRDDGSLDRCWKAAVLQDSHLGEHFACHGGLMRTSALSGEDCRASCVDNPLCAVWEYSLVTRCWQGTGAFCGSWVEVGSGLLATGAQRLQHGDVTVLKDLTGWEIKGLKNLGDTAGPGGNETQGIANCRAWCYSNLQCQYWLFGHQGCWAEDPQHAGPIQYPLTTGDNGAATRFSRLALTVVAGEYIQHSCPSRPVDEGANRIAIVDGTAQLGEEGIGLSWDIGLTFVVTLFASVMACHLMGASRELWRRVKHWDEAPGSGSEEEDSSELWEDEGLSWEARLWRLPFAPFLTFANPAALHKMLKGKLANAGELKDIAEVAPSGPRMLANYLAWRRITIGALLMLGIVCFVLQCEVLSSTWDHHKYFAEIGRSPALATYEAFVASRGTKTSDFLTYSREKLMALLAGVLGEVLRGAFLIECVVCCIEVLPIVALLFALLSWTSFGRSQRHVRIAWAIAFICPFVVSLFPMRLLLSFSVTDSEVRDYVHELAVALHLDRAQQLLLGSCGQISSHEFEQKVVGVGDSLRRTCQSVSSFPLELAAPCLSHHGLCHVNLARAVDGCHEAVKQFDMGHVGTAVDLLRQECDRIREAFAVPSGEGTKGDEEKSFKLLVDMMRTPLDTLVPSVEVVSITVSAVHAVLIVLPGVVGIAPGLIRAGMATKVLVPHSELPGALILVVPIILASAGWLVCTILFQYVSHLQALGLFVVLLGSPLAMATIGVFTRVTRPMERQPLQKAIRILCLTSAALMAMALCLVPGIAKDASKIVEKVPGLHELVAWCDVNWLRLGAACGVHVLYLFLLTAFGGTDWMVSDISAQRDYWVQLGHVDENPPVAILKKERTMELGLVNSSTKRHAAHAARPDLLGARQLLVGLEKVAHAVPVSVAAEMDKLLTSLLWQEALAAREEDP